MKMARVICLFMAGLFFCASAQAADSFSADLSSLINQQPMNGKIYVSSDRTRTEIGGMVVIARMDKKLAWTLMPGTKSYMEMPVDMEQMIVGYDKMPGEIERKSLGQETIDGKLTDKYRVVTNQNGKQQAVFSWVAVDSGIPLKTSAEDGSWVMEFRNIVAAPQPDSLFELPAGYQKMSMPASMDTSGLPEGIDLSGYKGMSASDLMGDLDVSKLSNLTQQLGIDLDKE